MYFRDGVVSGKTGHKYDITSIDVIYLTSDHISQRIVVYPKFHVTSSEKAWFIDGLNCQGFAEIFPFTCDITTNR